MLRRMTVKHHPAQEKVEHIYNAYHLIGNAATIYNAKHLADLKIAPPPGDSHRKKWKQKDNLKGPIGLLLQDLHLYAAALSPDLIIHRHNESPISISHLPWQHLAIEVEHLFLLGQDTSRLHKRAHSLTNNNRKLTTMS